MNVAATVARRETLPRERRRPPALQDLIGDYRTLFGDRDYLFPLAANTLLWAGMMGYMASSSFLFQEVFGLDGGMYAVVFGGHGAVMILAAQLSARLTNRYGLRPVVAFGACGAGDIGARAHRECLWWRPMRWGRSLCRSSASPHPSGSSHPASRPELCSTTGAVPGQRRPCWAPPR